MKLVEMPRTPNRAYAKPVAILIAALLLIASLTFAMWRPPNVALSGLWLGTVQVGNVERTVSGQGTLIPAKLVTISSPSGGVITRLHEHAGSGVEKGQLLISLENADLKQRLVAAEKVHAEDAARLAQMELELLAERLDLEAVVHDLVDQVSIADYELTGMEELARENVISVLQHKKAEAAARSLKRKLEQAKYRLEQFNASQSTRSQAAKLAANLGRQELLALRHQYEGLEVRAPEAGVLYELAGDVTEGAPILPGSILARISTSNLMDVELSVSSSAVSAITPGTKMTIDTGRGELVATVTRIDPRAIQGDVQVTASLPENELGLDLRPGQTVTGSVVTGLVRDATYVLRPQGVDEDSTSDVFVVDSAQRQAVRVEATFGDRIGKYIEVRKGLTEGQEVVLSDMNAYKNVDEIRISNE